MPFTLSTSAVLGLFYIVFSSQIFLISIRYAGKLARRIEHVLDNYPPARYPKLYPGLSPEVAEWLGRRRLAIFRAINRAIALLGVVILAAMAMKGYRPDLKGGDEIFVLLYFFLQVSPLLWAEIRELHQYRLMRKAHSSPRREAVLTPRRLFDFISPRWVVAAVVALLGCLAYYLAGEGPIGAWRSNVYITLAAMIGTNLLFAGVIFKALRGKKSNPYQAYQDQLRQIETVSKALVYASIMISLFLIATIAVDRHALEVFDPPLTSLYMQLCAVFGIGFTMRRLEIDSLDFDVYKEESAAPTA